MNNIVIEGRLAQDPEQKQSQNGKNDDNLQYRL